MVKFIKGRLHEKAKFGLAVLVPLAAVDGHKVGCITFWLASWLDLNSAGGQKGTETNPKTTKNQSQNCFKNGRILERS